MAIVVSTNADISPGDAESITRSVTSTVKGCVEQYGEAVVTTDVVASAQRLDERSAALASLAPEGYQARKAIDVATDRCLGSLYGTCDLTVQCYSQSEAPLENNQRAEFEAAIALLASLFPEGIVFIKGRWSQQYGTTAQLIARAKEEGNQTHLATLGLLNKFALLERLHDLYGTRMGFTQFSTEADPMDDWLEAVEAFLAIVVAKHDRKSKLRELLLRPYDEAMQKIRDNQRKTAARKAKAKAKTDPAFSTRED